MDLSTAGLLFTRPHWPGQREELHSVGFFGLVFFCFPTWGAGAQSRGSSSIAFPNQLTQSWLGNGAARIWTGTHVGCPCCRQQFTCYATMLVLGKFLLLFIFSFELKERERTSFRCWFGPQTPAIARGGPGPSQEPGAQCRPPEWVAGAQPLGPSSAITDTVVPNCITSRTACTQNGFCSRMWLSPLSCNVGPDIVLWKRKLRW